MEPRQAVPRAPVFGRVPLVTNRLRKAGWCPQEIETLEKTSEMSFSCLIQASSLDRSTPTRAHGSHDTKDGLCKCEVVDPKPGSTNLNQAHVEGCRRSCEGRISQDDWKSVRDAVKRFVEAGQFPLLTITKDSRDNFVVKVQSSPPKGRPQTFIALSHVWADGLGVQRGFRLPACQLLRVQQTVHQLIDDCKLNFSKPVPFWLDTICIPKSDGQEPTAEEEALTGRALSQMAMIYQSAAGVLVLDQGMYSALFGGERPEATLMRIGHSRWMSRGWTFQEAAFAQHIYFKFKDNFVTNKILRDKYFEAKQIRPVTAKLNMLYNVPGDEVERQKMILHHCDPFVRPAQEQFAYIWKWYEEPWLLDHAQNPALGLQTLYPRVARRVVTDPNDEASIISILLGMSQDIHERLGRTNQPEERLRILFSSFTQVPAEILFHEGSRYPELGSRWIPRSIFRPTTVADSFHDVRAQLGQMAMVSLDGLTVTMNGLRFGFDLDEPRHDARVAHLKINDQVSGLQFDSRTMKDNWRDIARDEGQSRDDLAIIYLPTDERRAVLISVLGEVEGIIYGFFEAVIKVYQMVDLPDEIDSVIKMSARPNARRVENQQWCVG